MQTTLMDVAVDPGCDLQGEAAAHDRC